MIRSRAFVALLLAAGATAGCGSASERARPPDPPAGSSPGIERRTTETDPWAVEPTLPAYAPTPVRLAEPAPVAIDIAAIGVDAPLDPLGLRPDGTMEVPVDFARAGWFSGGPRPGENGPSVIAGHVDNRSGPAVFFELERLRGGETIEVTRADGSIARFTVRRVETFEKRAFPTELVFGPTAGAELRLVTCGGEFDPAARSYRANVVVFAVPAPI